MNVSLSPAALVISKLLPADSGQSQSEQRFISYGRLQLRRNIRGDRLGLIVIVIPTSFLAFKNFVSLRRGGSDKPHLTETCQNIKNRFLNFLFFVIFYGF